MLAKVEKYKPSPIRLMNPMVSLEYENILSPKRLSGKS